MTDKNHSVYEGKTAGQVLKTARTTGRRKRELGTISKQLCIREEFLEALESGDYDKIPELVYILGFARNYAIELELDPKIIIQKIKQEMGIAPVVGEEKVPPKAVKAAAEVKKMKSETMSNAVNSGFRFIRKYWKWLLAAALLLTVAVIIVARVTGEVSQNGAGAASAQTESNTPLPEFKVATKEFFGNENRATATVILQATAETWLKVEDGRGETLFSRVMMPGDVYFAPVAGAKATVGNAGGLDVFINGKLASKLGPDHTRKSGINLTPTGLAPEAE